MARGRNSTIGERVATAPGVEDSAPYLSQSSPRFSLRFKWSGSSSTRHSTRRRPLYTLESITIRQIRSTSSVRVTSSRPSWSMSTTMNPAKKPSITLGHRLTSNIGTSTMSSMTTGLVRTRGSKRSFAKISLKVGTYLRVRKGMQLLSLRPQITSSVPTQHPTSSVVALAARPGRGFDSGLTR